jgi:hypothetical protein
VRNTGELLNHAHSQVLKDGGKTASDLEAWLGSLGSTFIDVRLYMRPIGGLSSDKRWLDERHIDNPETLQVTVAMSLERGNGRYAIWTCPERGVMLYDRRNDALKCYPSQEAAEMVAIHGA